MDRVRIHLTAQFIRFNIVGVTNTLLTYLVYSGLVFLGVHFRIALVAQYTVGILFTFFMNRAFTFRSATARGAGAFVRVVMVYAVVFLVNMASLSFLVETLRLNVYLTQAALLLVLAVFSFLAQKTFVFREGGSPQ